MSVYHTLSVEVSHAGRIATVTLQRPKVYNALNAQMIQELTKTFQDLQKDSKLHAILLQGEGSSFCAGADINWMRESVKLSEEENLADAFRLADMLQAIASSVVPVVAKVQGFAMGGGAGLLAAADIVIADAGTRFAFSEVKLGIVPAVISPLVMRKIGVNQASALFVTGERFDGERALRIGLIHKLAEKGQLDALTASTIKELLSGAPQAIRVSKHLTRVVSQLEADSARLTTAQLIASIRVSEEGQEGLQAFLEKRPPSWLKEAAEE